MKHAIAMALLASLALAGCGSGERQAGADDAPAVAATMPTTVADPPATAALRTFAGRDADHDGFVSSAENAAAADRIYDAIDVDQDGAVTAQEYTAARVALGLTSLPGTEELIAQADQDGDGQLTLAEWIASEGLAFRDADRNADGKLSQAEWDASSRLKGQQPMPVASAPAK